MKPCGLHASSNPALPDLRWSVTSHSEHPDAPHRVIPTPQHGFTLIEVMVSLAVIAIALVGLLGLQHQTLQSVVRAGEMTKAALLAQRLMTQVETGEFPALGTTSGNFESIYPRQFPNFRWEQSVEPSAVFPDVRKVRIRIRYGPRLARSFQVTELIRNPLALQNGN